MATRLSVHHSSGICVGRCDARCHNAKTKRCSCICGGRYHGHGDDILAVDMTKEDLGRELQSYANRQQCDVDSLTVKVADTVQLRLFPVERRAAA